jgi:hypothetical protein
MDLKKFPVYFVGIFAVYAAVLGLVLTSLGSVAFMLEALPIVLFLILPAVLFVAYLIRFPVKWMRLTICAVAIAAIAFSAIFLLPIL